MHKIGLTQIDKKYYLQYEVSVIIFLKSFPYFLKGLLWALSTLQYIAAAKFSQNIEKTLENSFTSLQ